MGRNEIHLGRNEMHLGRNENNLGRYERGYLNLGAKQYFLGDIKWRWGDMSNSCQIGITFPIPTDDQF